MRSEDDADEPALSPSAGRSGHPSGQTLPRTGHLRTHHILWLIVAMFIVATTVVTAMAVAATRSIDRIASDGRSQTELETMLLSLSRELDELVVDTQEASRSNRPFDLDGDQLVTDTEDATEAIRIAFDSLFPDQAAEGDLAIFALRNSVAGLIEQIEQVLSLADVKNDQIQAGQLSVLSARTREYEQNLSNVQSIFDEAKAKRLDALTDLGTQRLTLIAIIGVPIGALLIGAMMLIGRIRRTEDQLLREIAHEKAYLQAVVDCVPASLAWKDRNSIVIGVNRTLRELLEASGTPELVGHRVSDIARTAGRTTWMEIERLEQEAIASGGTCDEEFSVQTRTGLRTFRYSTSAIHLNGEIIGGVTFNEDVTDSRDMEQALSTTNRMESIGQLAAGVAHEINTPVQYVSDNNEFLTESFSDMLRGIDRLADAARNNNADEVDAIIAEMDLEFLSDEVPSALSQSREGLDRMTEIVRAMKDFSDPGDDVSKQDLNRMIESTAAVSRNEWTYVADLRLKLDPDLPHVSGSEDHLSQAVLNMIINAAHAVSEAHGPDGRGTITISTTHAEQTTSAHACVQIIIEDDGVGMTPSVQERIFSQFFTTKDVGKGTGQGLSMAWEVVTGHGGTIEVDSEVGRGSRFVISLPLEPSDVAAGSSKSPGTVSA